MDKEFWLNRWKEEKISFHSLDFNPKLLQYFPTLKPQKNQSVLITLCGKTKDILWFNEQGLIIHGVELSEKAILDFFTENNLPFNKEKENHFINYIHQNIILSVGDFFKLKTNQKYDFIYDRASLVALPKNMRGNYAKVITDSLKEKGKYFLIIYEYDQNEIDGPPFSVNEEEIHTLYEKFFKITLLENECSKNQSERFKNLSYFNQKVYLLEKK